MAKIIIEKKFPLSTEKEVIYFLQTEKYLDMLSGIAVNSLGHAHPKLVKAIRDQSKTLACF